MHVEVTRLLIELYDDLIVSVEGYNLAEARLENAETIIREMDAAHQRLAVLALFATTAEEIQEYEERS